MKSRSRRGRRFGLKFLMLLTAIFCIVLAQYYPRVYEAVEIEWLKTDGAVGDIATYRALSTSRAVLRRVFDKSPELKELSGDDDPIDWAIRQLRVSVVDEETTQVRVLSRPSKRRKMGVLVVAVAREAIAFVAESQTGMQKEVIAALRTAREDLLDNLAGKVDADRQRVEVFLQEMDMKLAEMETEEKLPEFVPQITERTSGWVFAK